MDANHWALEKAAYGFVVIFKEVELLGKGVLDSLDFVRVIDARKYDCDEQDPVPVIVRDVTGLASIVDRMRCCTLQLNSGFLEKAIALPDFATSRSTTSLPCIVRGMTRKSRKDICEVKSWFSSNT